MVCFSPVGFDALLLYYTSNPTGEKHTISTFVDQTRIQLTCQRRKNSFASLPVWYGMLWYSIV